MADPKWKVLRGPVFSRAVSLLSNLMQDNNFLNLLENRVLNSDENDIVFSQPEFRFGTDDLANQLLTLMSEKPPGSYDELCEVLCEVDRGKKLFDLMKARKLQIFCLDFLQ